MTHRILIIDDHFSQALIMQKMLCEDCYEIVITTEPRKLLDQLNTVSETYDLIIIDLIMPDVTGLEILNKIRSINKDIPVIVATAQGSVDMAINAMRAGANDFIVKPVDLDRLKVSVNNALKMRSLSGEIKRLKMGKNDSLAIHKILGTSEPITRVRKLSEKAAQSDIPVLISGESGVGKEVVARAIHSDSSRAHKPMITVNCGALPENLVESILFGHEKGSFTGADKKHIGKFVQADGGTIFLDEISELPLTSQVKLLRVLQEREVDPLGSTKTQKVNARIISATNRSLKEQVAKGNFREDLFYRMHVYPIEIPPLRERVEDIPHLCDSLLSKICDEENKPHITIDENSMEALKKYDWPGNIRELENALFRAVVLCDNCKISIKDFPNLMIKDYINSPDNQIGSEEIAMINANSNLENEQMEGLKSTLKKCKNHANNIFFNQDGEIKNLEEVKGDLIKAAYIFYNGNMTRSSKSLGISRSTFYRKVAELDLIKKD